MTRPPALEVGICGHLRQIVEGLDDGVIIYAIDGSLHVANAKALAMHGEGGNGHVCVHVGVHFGVHVEAYIERFDLYDDGGARLADRDYPACRALRGEILKDVMVAVAPRGLPPSCPHKVHSVQLRDQQGRLEFVALVLRDLSGLREAERRFEQAFAANPAPSIICRIADLRFVKVNDGFLELTGYDRNNVIGHSIYEIDVLEGAPRRDLAIHNLEAGAPIAKTEAVLRPAGGGTAAVLVAGQPIEMDAEACMLFTFVDLGRQRAW